MDSFVLGGTALCAAGLGSFFAGREGNDAPKEVLTAKRIRTYPYVAGLTLVGMNLLLEYFGPATINFIFMFYFGLAGTNSIWFLLRTFIPFRGPRLFMYPRSHTIITEFILPATPVPFHAFDLVLYWIALSINIAYYRLHDNLTNNIIAFSISFFSTLSIRIEKFTAAAPLLWSLLIYDVFFVYSTEVMTSVAVNLRGPIKLVYRKADGDSVLGLGDIVIPGLFLSVCSRFDTFLHKLVKRRTPYWAVGMIGYTGAVILTDIVCYWTKSGQPALLFITPAVTVPVVVLAILRKEHYAFMSFSG
jgi:minor histocompatibility antigen H13